jgi:hypothetical protein
MKNIHLLPTDKTSNLTIRCKTSELMYSYKAFGNMVCYDVIINKNQHLYITNLDEDSKYYLSGTYIIHNNKIHEVIENKGLYISVKELSHIDIRADLCKKIVFTTDQDLINNGIQAINDDFLQWFVKNANESGVPFDRCEVEVIPNSSWGFDTTEPKLLGYKLIIPQEETKSKFDKKDDVWIALCDKMPTTELNGEKVLVYRIMNTSQLSLAISIMNTCFVKHCDINETWWTELPNPPNTKI